MSKNITTLRIKAFLIDFSISLVVSIPFLLLIIFFNINNQLYLSFVLALVFSSLFCKDLFGGKSFGKRKYNLCIMAKPKHQLSNSKLILRNISIIVWPIELALIFINSGKRLGDIFFSTEIINNKGKDENVQIKSIIIPCVIVFVSLFLYFYFIVMALSSSNSLY